MFDRYNGNSLEKAIVFSTNGVGTNLDITMQKKEFDPIVENFDSYKSDLKMDSKSKCKYKTIKFWKKT